ncbi:MAG TPA: hypothetical protein VK137_16390, partial [Planctomycetaceae bacterium]|nr:hypothetical protein [Planctomycetaceae bacterium]
DFGSAGEADDSAWRMRISDFKFLQQRHRRAPFRPFVVELLNGDRVEVDHPEALIVRGGTAIFDAADGTPTWFDHESVNSFIANGSKKSRRE